MIRSEMQVQSPRAMAPACGLPSPPALMKMDSQAVRSFSRPLVPSVAGWGGCPCHWCRRPRAHSNGARRVGWLLGSSWTCPLGAGSVLTSHHRGPVAPIACHWFPTTPMCPSDQPLPPRSGARKRFDGKHLPPRLHHGRLRTQHDMIIVHTSEHPRSLQYNLQILYRFCPFRSFLSSFSSTTIRGEVETQCNLQGRTTGPRTPQSLSRLIGSRKR